MHNELPDVLVPHKHYASEVIEEVLDNKALSLGLAEEDYPCDVTKERWNSWFKSNMAQIEGILRSVLFSISENIKIFGRTDSLLLRIRKEKERWLSYCVKGVYSSGHSLLFNST